MAASMATFMSLVICASCTANGKPAVMPTSTEGAEVPGSLCLLQTGFGVSQGAPPIQKSTAGAEAVPGNHFWFQSKFPEPAYYKDDPFISGPTQVDDLGFLFGVIKEIRPKTVVEIGAFKGDGSKLFLSAVDEGSKVFSFDPFPHPRMHELQLQMPASKYKFLEKSGESMNATDLEGRQVDFGFIDASHVLQNNQAIWRTLVPLLSDTAVVAIHDTGFWSKQYLDQHQAGKDWRPGPVLGTQGKEYYLHPNSVDERKFVNWITDTYPEFEAMNFHTFNYLRNGVTLVQRKARLEVPEKAETHDDVDDVGVSGQQKARLAVPGKAETHNDVDDVGVSGQTKARLEVPGKAETHDEVDDVGVSGK